MQEKSMPASNTGIMRATHLLQLPQEMLTEIIRYLPPAEKSKVRATCSLFKDLVNQPVVWQKSTIVLRRISAFNAEFWDVLRKRKITSVEVKEIGLKQWQKLLRFMPGLLDVTVDSLWSEEILQGLQLLTDLQKLHLKMCSRLSERSVIREIVHFQHLTHLLLCDITFLRGRELIKIACLQNLHMLSLHTVQKALPEKALEYVLFHLPKLRELSLSYILNKEHFLLCLSLPDRHHIPYSSEERFLDQLSTIHTLTVCYIKDFLLHSVDVFGQLLKNLPNLTELNLLWISNLDMFVDNIPSSLVKLSVIGTKLSNSALSCLSDKSWKLREMDLTLSYGFDEKTLKQFPHLFPLLTRLCLSGFVLTDNILMSLAKMESLRELDVTGSTNLTKEAIQNFRITTDCRVHLLVERHSVSSKCDCLWST
ncbi:uncharacterized protein LOC119857398 isoform X2 [Dermochelys coriacea]|uniref:uncharacterized protein LOC119857398 isoform X2 n=1 Tax=Dermochelys coriacea TaxID=27794 RepID=UPI0018E76EE2|nr:uncharacterized protein LOC119857398 isoform X2 [Dermochelys coriacea]XP_043371889.1 uncharacterized protein LOC119857398 isoform X2 [Dermochelys coriacea]